MHCRVNISKSKSLKNVAQLYGCTVAPLETLLIRVNVVELVGGGSVFDGATLSSFFSRHRPSGLMLSINRNVRLRVRVSVHVFTFEVPFKRLFLPTSQSWMFNNFRDSESLGK